MRRVLASATLVLLAQASAGSAAAEPIGIASLPDRPGTVVTITYSYANLFDGTFLLLRPAGIRAATEEALRLWSSHAPLRFIERTDSGPLPSDVWYAAANHPDIRFGHHSMLDLAHAYIPDGTENGLNGDVHFDSGIPWTVGVGRWDFLETVTHEIGHSLGLDHETGEPAVMNPSYPQRRFIGLGSAFLFPSDIRAIRALYGSGRGSVEPLAPVPEPSTLILLCSGLGIAAARLRRTRRAAR